ncbi:polymorphic toxin type 50 domain-containing protein [Ellagibacter isourolithinifaciens]|uniref:polymorphic toxin type 50 domain-containing protein n=1 Tax=Ellagibacter isourolithinifaciens TaxID=2137581 RepID=UPI003AACB0DB
MRQCPTAARLGWATRLPWLICRAPERRPTTRGTIHYGKKGAHIVPSKPGGD